MSGAELDIASAFAVLTGALAPLTATERVAAARAAGRVLAGPVRSAVDLPAFDNAAMDGYALRAADTAVPPVALRVIGRVLAGKVFGGRIGPGECVRIMTGAPLPEGSDAILVQEDAELDGDRLWIRAPLSVGRHRRLRGEHVAAGATVLEPGRRLRGADVGLAVSVGATGLAVFRRLRVGVLSTGDELLDPPAPLTGARSYDANRPLLIAALARDGVDSLDLGIVADEPAAFDKLLVHAAALGLDAILTTGGAAQGDADIVRRATGVQYIPLAVRPGRGIAWGRLDPGRPLALLGLPGNAVAAFVIFNLLARPVLRHLAGEAASPPRGIAVPLAHDLPTKPGRIDYQRGRLLRDAGGRLVAEPLAQQGSAMLRTVSEADVLLAVGPGSRPGPGTGHRAGDLVDALLLDALE